MYKPAKPKDVPMADQQKPRIADDARVLEIYGNKVVSTSFDGGAVVITIGTGVFSLNESTMHSSKGSNPSFM
jgi:hypothetical protein